MPKLFCTFSGLIIWGVICSLIESAFLRHKYTPRDKIFSVLGSTVVRSEFPGRSSADGFFASTPKNTQTYQNGLRRHLTWLALLFLADNFDSLRTLKTRVRVSWHLIHHLWRNRPRKVSNFAEISPRTNFRFLAYKILFKVSEELNGSRKLLVASCFRVDHKQLRNNKRFPFWIFLPLRALSCLSCPVSRTPPAPCSPGFPPPCPPPLTSFIENICKSYSFPKSKGIELFCNSKLISY